MNRTLFVVKYSLNGKTQTDIKYTSMVSCLEDRVLKVAFIKGHITACSIFCDTTRMAGLPEVSLTWPRFVDALISNAASIFRSAYSEGKDT